MVGQGGDEEVGGILLMELTWLFLISFPGGKFIVLGVVIKAMFFIVSQKVCFLDCSIFNIGF